MAGKLGKIIRRRKEEIKPIIKRKSELPTINIDKVDTTSTSEGGINAISRLMFHAE